VTSLESGLGGKMSDELSSKPYVAKVAALVAQVYKEGDEVVVAGPGNFKNSIANQIREDVKTAQVHIFEGLDLTGGDAVRALVKEPAFHNLAKGSLVVEMQKLVAEAIRRISTGDGKVAYGLPRVKEAAAAGAVEACAVSDNVFSSGVDEEQLVEVLNSVESKGGSVYMTDSSMEYGKQVSSFGGILALLRYAIRF
jgi:protein pelota